MDRVLEAVLESGPPLVGEYLGPPELGPGKWSGPEVDAVQRFRLATATEGMKPAGEGQAIGDVGSAHCGGNRFRHS